MDFSLIKYIITLIEIIKILIDMISILIKSKIKSFVILLVVFVNFQKLNRKNNNRFQFHIEEILSNSDLIKIYLLY